MTREEFIERQPQTEEEKRLWEKIAEYEDAYFEDFTLQPDSILHDFICIETEDDSGNLVEYANDLPDKGLFYLEAPYAIKIENLDNHDGICNLETRTITIDPEHVDDQKVILHEMIHAYISQFKGDRIAVFLECLLLRLYNELKIKIPDLEGRIINHAHTIKQEDFNGHGSHGLLFFLKSLDLDLRLNLPLGSICSYGRDII
jgi:hypothetical protein